MVQARIHVELSDGRWKSDVSRRYPESSFRIRGMVMSGDCAAETVVVSGRDTDPCLSDLESHPLVDSFDVIEEHRNGVTVHLETVEPVVHGSVAKAGTPLACPATLQRGELTATVLGTREAISSLGEHLRADGLTFELAYIGSGHDDGSVLTDRQEEVFFTAVEEGYYRSPRQCTLTEIAETLGIAKSTCSGTLQRAEESVVEYYCLQQQLPGRPA